MINLSPGEKDDPNHLVILRMFLCDHWYKRGSTDGRLLRGSLLLQELSPSLRQRSKSSGLDRHGFRSGPIKLMLSVYLKGKSEFDQTKVKDTDRQIYQVKLSH